MTDSPVVALNHAVAVSMTEGPAAALALVDTIVGLDSYHLLHTPRVEFFTRLGRDGDAAEAYRRALPLALNLTERRFIEGRLGPLSAIVGVAGFLTRYCLGGDEEPR